MKPTLLFVLSLLVAPLFAADVPINISGTALVIPSPTGFVPVTAEMGALNKMLESFVVAQNERFVSFFPEEFLPAVTNGLIPQMKRTLSVQTARAASGRIITASDFAGLKEVMVKQNEEMVKKIEQEMPGAMEKINKKIEGQFDAKLDMSLAGMVPLPPHENTERTFGFSLLVNYKLTAPDGAPTNVSGVVTTTFIWSKAKLFFTYVNGAENDLEWTRKLSHDWAAAILAANPPDAAMAALETSKPSRFDWTRIWTGALVGALAGGVYGLVRVLMKRTKKD